MLKREYEIIKAFVDKPWRKFTFKEVKEYAKKKSESYVYNSLKKYVKQNILVEEKAGNVVLYSLNRNSEKAFVYVGFVAEYLAWNKKHIPFDDMQILMKKIPTTFCICLVTGSYARNTQKKDSDIDMAIICDNSNNPKKIYSELKHDCEMNIPPIHLYVFRKEEFMTMLLDKTANYGKEIAKNNLILLGGQNYYKILAEAIEHGFNG